MSLKRRIWLFLRNMYKTWMLHYLYPSKYQKYAKRPIDKTKIVFLEVRESELTDNFREIYYALKKENKYSIKVCYIQEGMVKRAQVRKNCLSVLEDLALARYIFIDDSSYLIGCLPIRCETEVIQTWHACGAFKKFGYSVAGKVFGAEKKDLERFPLHRNFSIVTVSSEEVVWAYAEAFHMENCREKIMPVGVSRTDCFFKKDFILAATRKVYEMFPQTKGKKILLYAPTFRGKVSEAYAPDMLDIELLKSALQQEMVLLCKYHPFAKKRPQIPEACQNFAWDVTEKIEIEDLLAVSDVCITDYSSLIFEYSLMERPMIFFAYDLEEYDDWRGFYYPYEQLTPGPVVRSTEEIVEYLKHLESNFDRRKVQQFRRKYMGNCDGHATERILKLLDV